MAACLTAVCLCGVQALSQAVPGDASVYLLLGMLRNAKGNKEAAANAYTAAVRISLVSVPLPMPALWVSDITQNWSILIDLNLGSSATCAG